MSGARWTDEELAEVARRYRAGEDDAEIAAAIGRTTGAVSNIRRAKGIARPNETLKRSRPWSAEALSKARALYADGWPNAHIAEQVGRSRTAIKRAVTAFSFARRPEGTLAPACFDTEAETWRHASVSGYAVSSQGRLMSLLPGFLGQILREWQDGDGYRHVQLQVDGRSKRHALHVLVAEAFRGPRPSSSHQAAHNNGRPSDNWEGNIRWATPAENRADRLVHGTAPRHPDGRYRKARL